MSVDRSIDCTVHCVDFSFFASFNKLDSDSVELVDGTLSNVVDGIETAFSSLCFRFTLFDFTSLSGSFDLK